MASQLQPSTTGAEAEVRRRIQATGPITFAEFMAVALYWPDSGYYAGGSPIGAAGDFFTAPHAHPAFGALIARYLQSAWDAMGSPTPFWAVELGAGTGRLAADVVAAAGETDPRFAAALRYVGVDVRQPAPGTGVEWLLAERPAIRRVRGVMLANELLDAMPVHRVAMAEGRLVELHVGNGTDGRLEEVEGAAAPALAERLAELGVTLGEGRKAEINLGLGEWMRRAAGALEDGYLLLVDYGHNAADYYAPSRPHGTLRSYYKHTLSMNPYRHVGRQDISAHVELTTLRREAESAGFATAGEASQADFLSNLGFDAYRAELAARPGLAMGVRRANLTAMDSLVDPQGMGGFRVLAFTKKNNSSAALPGFVAAPGLPKGEAPLLGPGHMPRPGAEEPAMPSWDELMR